MDERELIGEFLIESGENLARLESEIVSLEQRPQDPELLASIFRTVHTIKGTCGFFSFSTLEGITHIAENLLAQLRNGERSLTPELTSLVLETMDAIRKELASIEATSKESGANYLDLRRRLALVANATPPIEEAAAPQQASTLATPVSDATIRVGVSLLDKLMNLVGELVLARNQVLQYQSRQDDPALNATAQRLNVITTQLQEGVMKTRMQPIGMVWGKLPRLVRDLAANFEKQIHLEMEGAETELDRSIIESIKDPLTHIVRNCCDHGIERPEVRAKAGKAPRGRLHLRAYHEGGQVNIEVADDGGGVDVAHVKQKALERGLLRAEQIEQMTDREAVHLVFHPGLSTARKITSISGRGVGMDVVKTNIERIGGTVDLISVPGYGTTVKIKIPLTLAIIPGLVVHCGGERFIIPQVSLVELLRLEASQIERIHGTPVYRRRGNLLPVAYLNETLKLPAPRDADAVNIVVLQAENHRFGLVVDGIHDTQEIVVKPLGKQLKRLGCYSGATIMGDGRVALILDVVGVAQASGVSATSVEVRTKEPPADTDAAELQSFLLFRAGSFDRLAVPLSLVSRLEEFPASRVERAGGSRVVQYRERILRLTPLGAILAGKPTADPLPDPAQVIVFSEGSRMAGLVVDQIVDIHSERIRIGTQSARPGLAGSAVLGGEITDFLDLPAILAAAEHNWPLEHEPAKVAKAPVAVLIADASTFSRGLVRNYLELAGHPVIEAFDNADALRKLDGNEVGIVVVSTDLPPGGGQRLAEEMRQRPELSAIPVVALCRGDNPAEGSFAASVERGDRSGLLESLQRLSAALAAEERG